MKKENGFTLIELLAVIVILAIIALIATPIVLNLIEKARKGAAKDASYGVRKAAQLYYQTALLENVSGLNGTITVSFNNGNITVTPSNSNLSFELDGTKPSSGEIQITKDGQISGSVVINNYTCTIPNVGDVECSKGESSSSTSEVTTTQAPSTPEVTTVPQVIVSTISTCPDCVFRRSTIEKNIGDTLTDDNTVTNDYTVFAQYKNFLGHTLNNDGTIKESFVCGIESGTTFCIKSLDTWSTITDTLISSIGDCYDEGYGMSCSGDDLNAGANQGGYVYIDVPYYSCEVDDINHISKCKVLNS